MLNIQPPVRIDVNEFAVGNTPLHAAYEPPRAEPLGHWQVRTMDTMSVEIASLVQPWRGA